MDRAHPRHVGFESRFRLRKRSSVDGRFFVIGMWGRASTE